MATAAALGPSARQGHLRLWRWLLAAAIVLWPLLTVISLLFTRAITGNGPNPNGAQALAGYVGTGGAAMATKFAIDMASSFLMPFGFLGMTALAIWKSPWLSTVGGILTLVGSMSIAAFVALDGFTYEMARMGGGQLMIALWDRYNNGPVNNAYTIIFILGVVFGPIVLGIALARAHAVPVWAAVLVVVSRLVLVAGFPLHLNSLYVDTVAYLLLLAGSLPAAGAILSAPVKRREREETDL